MSQSALQAPRTGFKFTLSVRGGPDQGAAFQLLPPRVTLGRGPDNNVALTDPRMSRSAAAIEFSMEHIIVKDLSGKDTLVVNGQRVKEASIQDGDVIFIGGSELVFGVEALELPPSGQIPAARSLPPSGIIFDQNMQGARPDSFVRKAPVGRSKPDGKLIFYGVILIAGALLAWVLLSGKVIKPKDKGLRTTEEVEKDIKASEDRQEVIIKKRHFNSDEEKTRYEEAQKHYLAGFRDYQKGQWSRAMRSFETARAIDPEHELARRYFKLSEKQHDEEVALLILEGHKYKDKNMYTRCSSALDKAMDEITNKDDAKFKEADALKKECDLLIDERFQ